jgi:hypothetical protein
VPSARILGVYIEYGSLVMCKGNTEGWAHAGAPRGKEGEEAHKIGEDFLYLDRMR